MGGGLTLNPVVKLTAFFGILAILVLSGCGEKKPVSDSGANDSTESTAVAGAGAVEAELPEESNLPEFPSGEVTFLTGDERGESRTAVAVALGPVEGSRDGRGTGWAVEMPGVEFGSSYGGSEVQLTVVSGVVNGSTGNPQRSFACRVLRRVAGTDLFLLTSDNEAVIPETGDGAADATLVAGGFRRNELMKLFMPELGPFQVTGVLEPGGGELTIRVEGTVWQGAAGERILLAVGLEADARQGYDAEGRKFLVDLERPSSSEMKVAEFPINPMTGRSAADVRLRIPRDAKELRLVGQLLLQPKRGKNPAVPEPPFEIRMTLGDLATMEITGDERFRTTVDEDGSPMDQPFLSQPEVIDLPGQVALNQAVLSPVGLVLAMDATPAAMIYQPASGKLEELPTGLSGKSMLVAADRKHVFLLDTAGGVIEKWDAAGRKLVTAGVINAAEEVLAIAALEGPAESYLAMLCKERFRFLSLETLAEVRPTLATETHRSPDLWIDDFRVFTEKAAGMESGVAETAFHGFAVMFRGSPQIGGGHEEVTSVVLHADNRPGRIMARTLSSEAMIGPTGHSSFNLAGRVPPYEMRIVQHQGVSDALWQVPESERGLEWAGFFASPGSGDLVLAAQEQSGVIPRQSYQMTLHSKMGGSAKPIALGHFGELVGCLVRPLPGVPCLSRQVFFLPEHGAILTLNDGRRKLFRRKLDTVKAADHFAGGAFMLTGGVPDRVWRGQRFAFRVGVAGCVEPAFEISEGPQGAVVSEEGWVEWDCPVDFAEAKVAFRIKVTDPESGRALDQLAEVTLFGPRPALAVAADGGDGRRMATRIHDVPAGGAIIDKRDVAQGRHQVMVTELDGGRFRLEVFDVDEETWLPGADLPARPDAMVANPQIVYLVYSTRKVMEMRSVTEPGRVREVALKLPLLAIGCSRDHVDGVLCLAEKLDPQQEKIGEFIDWDGTRVTVNRVLGLSRRLVFLSPLDLKPLPLTMTTEEMQQAVFFMENRQGAGPDILAISADGLQAAYNHRFLDFGTGTGTVRVGRHQLGFHPNWVGDRGRILYGSGSKIQMMTEPVADDGPVFEGRDTGFDRSASLRPVPGKALVMGLERISTQHLSETRVVFRPEAGGDPVLTIGPLLEVEQFSEYPRFQPQIWLRNEMAAIHGDKLITVGNRWRQLVVRDLGLP